MICSPRQERPHPSCLARAPSDPHYRKKCLELRSQFEKTAHEHGATLEHVIAAKDKVYENPKTGEVFMKGKKPKWLEGHEEEYLVK